MQGVFVWKVYIVVMLATISQRSWAWVRPVPSFARGAKRTFAMKLNCGIVGLPNVGKSTLFNALVGSESAQAANFPFCTIGEGFLVYNSRFPFVT